jgi:hypothetical protein
VSPVTSPSSRTAPALGRMVAGVGLSVVTLLALGCAGAIRPGTESPVASSSPSPTASSASAQTPSSPEDRWKVRPEGAGPVEVGMTLDEVEAATSSAVRPLGPPAEGSACAYVTVAGTPKGLAFMVDGNRVVRVDVHDESPVRTLEGAGIGSTEDEVKALYPGLRVEPAKYLEGGHDLVHTASPTTKIIFETDGAKVLAFHAGKEPQVSYVEGCS